MTNRTQIKKIWRIYFADSSSVFELRGLWPKGVEGGRPPVTAHVRAAEFADIESFKAALEDKALRLNDQGYNVYIVMNPIRPDYTSDKPVTDADIAYRDLLLIDIDRAGDTSCPASDEELQAARDLALDVRAYLESLGWDKPIMMMSGNGYHLYYVLEGLGNTPDEKAVVSGVLHDLATRFNNDVVAIDTTVSNASRITKVPGTIMRKGQESAERPYRVAEVCDE